MDISKKLNPMQEELDARTIKGTNEPIIQLHDVCKVYTTGAGDFNALNEITLDIQEGEFLGIIGKSGAGKTTLNVRWEGLRLSKGTCAINAPSGRTGGA